MAAPSTSTERTFTREEIMSKAMTRLREHNAVVTEDEVATIMDAVEHSGGLYDHEALVRVCSESLRLWSDRDQAGMVCTLRLNQENIMNIVKPMSKEIQDLSSKVEALLMERISELEAKVEALAQGRPPAGGKAQEAPETTLDERIKDFERRLEAMEKGTDQGEGQGSGQSRKEARRASTLHPNGLEDEVKQREAWGHLKSYDQAFEELLRKDPIRNNLERFEKRSEEIKANHDVFSKVKELIPQLYGNALNRLGNSVKLNFQPYCKDIDALMRFHEDKKPLFDEKVAEVAEKTGGKALIPPMKGRTRCRSKAIFKYTDKTGTSWYRCTDVVRATILYDDIEAMYAGLELLEKYHKDGELDIIEFNDRYQRPLHENYRDIQLSVKIADMVCELQLNTKVMAFVKENAGHRNFEVYRELIAAVQACDARRCAEILRWGQEELDIQVQEILNQNPVLHEAAGTGNADLVSVFLDYGADVNMKDGDGQTALHKAMACGFERAAWALISAGADKSPKDNKGITPLMEGLLKLRVNPSSESVARAVSMVAQLCDESEFETLQEKLEELIKQRLVQSSELVMACRDANLEKAEHLLLDWADPNSKDASGESTVHAALTSGNADAMAKRAKVLCRVLEFRGDPEAATEEGNSALKVAAMRGNPTAAKALLDAGAAVGGTDDEGSTALHTAAANGHAEVVSLLVSCHASLEATTADGATPLESALESGHSEVIDLLKAADWNMAESCKDIFNSVRNGRLGAVRYFVKADLPVLNKPNSDGHTALQLAASLGQIKMIHLLLSLGASITVKTTDGRAAADFAKESGHSDIFQAAAAAAKCSSIFEAVKNADVAAVGGFLCADPASLRRTDSNRNTPLHDAGYYGKHEVVLALLAAQASVDAKNKDGETALLYAAQNGHTEVCRELLKAGAAVDAQSKEGQTALTFAAENGRSEICLELLKAGAAVDAQRKDGRTVLMGAAQSGLAEICLELLKAGAAVDVQTKEGRTALTFAAANGHSEICLELLKAGAAVDAQTKEGRTVLMGAAQSGLAEICLELLKAGVAVDAQTKEGRTALTFAADNGHTETCLELLKAGAAVDAQTNQGRTALIYAADNGHTETCLELLKAGAAVDAQTNQGVTVLLFAAENGNAKICQELLKAGAAVDAHSKHGRTALHRAAYRGHLEVVQLLVDAKADVCAKCNDRKTPLDEAKKEKNFEVVEFLKKVLEDQKQEDQKQQDQGPPNASTET